MSLCECGIQTTEDAEIQKFLPKTCRRGDQKQKYDLEWPNYYTRHHNAIIMKNICTVIVHVGSPSLYVMYSDLYTPHSVCDTTSMCIVHIIYKLQGQLIEHILEIS